jgi:hypothetical protein
MGLRLGSTFQRLLRLFQLDLCPAALPLTLNYRPEVDLSFVGQYSVPCRVGDSFSRELALTFLSFMQYLYIVYLGLTGESTDYFYEFP